MVTAKTLLVNAGFLSFIHAAALSRQKVISLQKRDPVAPDSSAVVNAYIYNNKNNQQKKQRGAKFLEVTKMNIPGKEPVPDWDDQFYDDEGRPLVYQVDTEELEDIMKNMMHEGKEKWASFLAVSDCNKFKKLIDKIKTALGKGEDCDDDVPPPPKKEKDCEVSNPTVDEDCDEVDEVMNIPPPNKLANSIKNTYVAVSEGNNNDDEYNDDEDQDSVDDDGDDDFRKTSMRCNTDSQPLFASISSAEANGMNEFLTEIAQYWEEEDPIKILEQASKYNYEKLLEFDSLSNEAEEEEDVEAANEEEDRSDFNDKLHIVPELTQSEREQYPLFDLDITSIDSKQSEWLKNNAIRRTMIIQNLLNGESVDEDVEIDKVEYENGNIFLDPDENYFINSSSGTLHNPDYPMGLLIAFLASEVTFFLL